MANSSKGSDSRKPDKPYKTFPLTPRSEGRWCKKIRGRMHYFYGTAEEALAEYDRVKDDLHNDREPSPKSEELTVASLCSKYLLAKRALLENGEISPRTWDDAKVITDRIVSAFGKTKLVNAVSHADFDRLRKKLAATLGVVALGNAVQRVRSVFKYGKDAKLIAQEVSFGPDFKRPSKKSLRLARTARGVRLFDARELKALIEAADVQLKAMILLAINGGMGNSDVAALHTKALDLDGGWLNFPRPKTGIDRKIPLWPETVSALRAALDAPHKPKDKADSDLVFVTKYGHSWGRLGRYTIDNTAPLTEDEKAAGVEKRKSISSNNALSKEFRKLTKAAGISRTFYDLRHTFATIGGEARDQVALSSIMGHADDSMAAVYRERISDERLRAVVNHVHDWLYADDAKDDGDSETNEAPAIAGRIGDARLRQNRGKSSRGASAESLALRIVG